MARIAGVDIPRDRRVVASLPVIYGIGPTNAQKILERTNISPDKRVRDLTEEEVNRIREIIDREYTVEGDLRREVNLNIKRLMEIGCYRGIRHRRGLPVHGQRTRTNACGRGPAGRWPVAARRRRRSKTSSLGRPQWRSEGVARRGPGGESART